MIKGVILHQNDKISSPDFYVRGVYEFLLPLSSRPVLRAVWKGHAARGHAIRLFLRCKIRPCVFDDAVTEICIIILVRLLLSCYYEIILLDIFYIWD